MTRLTEIQIGELSVAHLPQIGACTFSPSHKARLQADAEKPWKSLRLSRMMGVVPK